MEGGGCMWQETVVPGAGCLHGACRKAVSPLLTLGEVRGVDLVLHWCCYGAPITWLPHCTACCAAQV